MSSGQLNPVTENIWELNYPLSLIGAQLGRRVTILRLQSGKLLIHSTGPFTAADVRAIKTLGAPAWLVDVTLNHDTFSDLGRAAFPEIPYGLPDDFIHVDGERFSLNNPPVEWGDEIQVIEIAGMPRVREYAFYHRPSRTLIVADLVFNFERCSTWTRQFFRWAGGIKEYPGMSRLFASLIADKPAFTHSLDEIMRCDFDRLIVAHGAIIQTNAKQRLSNALKTRGFDV
jgi:hypothetical protein